MGESKQRDLETIRALQCSKAWQRIVARADVMNLARVGPIDLEHLSDAEHDEIRMWALDGTIAGAPPAILDYFKLVEGP